MVQRTLQDRLLTKIDRSGACWTWTGRKSTSGYGQIRIAGKTCYAHRVSYELFVGPIPEGLVIDHLCRNRACINPDHLEVVTAAVNTLRGHSPSQMTRRTGICQRGHVLAVDGVIVQRSRGTEYHLCRKCVRLSERGRRLIESERRSAAELAQLPRPSDPDDPAQAFLTTRQAAEAAHVEPTAIRDWARRGLITAVAHGSSSYYLELDVLQAEAQTRREARRRRLAAEAMEEADSQFA
jgi:hypothetical protein